MQTITIQILLLVLCIVLVAVGLAVGWSRYQADRKGVLGKKRVDAMLKKFGVIRNYRVLRDVTFAIGERRAKIEHMMVGFFGVLIASSVNDTAEYYGTARDEYWTKVTEQKRERIENFDRKNQQDIDVLREIFSKNGVYNIRMEGVVVFCGSRKKTLIGVTGSNALMDLRTFKAYLGKSKFEKDNDVDVPGLCALLEKYRQE